jgi:hypothetical protein
MRNPGTDGLVWVGNIAFRVEAVELEMNPSGTQSAARLIELRGLPQRCQYLASKVMPSAFVYPLGKRSYDSLGHFAH